jgi:hypothetical protein
MKFAVLALALSACSVQPKPVAPVAAPQVTVPFAARATFRINILQRFVGDEKWEAVSGGTAWIVRNDTDGSYLVTAGHVCDESEVEEGVEQGYSLTAVSGTEYPVAVERKHSTYDLCLVRTPEVVGPTLPLADAMPVYDTPVAAVGAPLGVFGCWGGSSVDQCGMAPISRGFYAGGTLVSMPMVGGNSGSAVFTSSGVIGVLVEGYRGFDSASFIEPIEHLRDFLE